MLPNSRFDLKRKGQPFQGVDEYRNNNRHGYKEPEATQAMLDAEISVAEVVESAISEVLGSRSVRDLREEYPNLWLDLQASVQEAYFRGHHAAWQDALLERGRESSAATGRMITAMLQTSVIEETPEKGALRILAAHHGIMTEEP